VPETLSLASFLGSPWLVVGTAICAALLVAQADWRVSLLLFALQAVLLALLNARHLPQGWAFLRMLVGGLVSVMWFLSARRVRWGGRQYPARWWLLRRSRGERWPLLSASGLLRLLAVALTGLVFSRLIGRVALPVLSTDLTLLCAWLWLAGLLSMALSDEPLRAGLGLLTLSAGFQLFYGALEASAASVGLLYGLDLCLGLAVSYLIVARGVAGRTGLAQQLGEESPAGEAPGGPLT
jgi:hypothetical protein